MYYVVMSAFHANTNGGRIVVSRHRIEDRAIERAEREGRHHGDCQCGGFEVVEGGFISCGGRWYPDAED